jgi:DNA adenine methylase
VVSEDEIEKAAHYYMEHHRMMKEQHDQENELLTPVESYIAPADFVLGAQRIRKGSWVLAAHVNDPDTWAKIKSGEYTGFSVGGSGIRETSS